MQETVASELCFQDTPLLDLITDKGALVPLFLSGIFLAIVLLIAAMVGFLCSRNSRIGECVTRTDIEGRRNSYGSPRRRPMSYVHSNRSIRRGLFVGGLPKNPAVLPQNGGISVSPSQPVVIETEDVEGGAVKIMITPPTPSKFKTNRNSGQFDIIMEERLEGSSRLVV